MYLSLASKLARAVRALLILQGDSSTDLIQFNACGDIFIDWDSRSRTVLPNRTVVVSSVDPQKGYRPEGILHLQIQHIFDAVLQPADYLNWETQRVKADAYMERTSDTLGIGGANLDQAMTQLADAITTAGRWLSIPDPTDTTGIANQICTNNADMVNFRCDWIKRARPFLTRGHRDANQPQWAEVMNFEAFVSYSNTALPN